MRKIQKESDKSIFFRLWQSFFNENYFMELKMEHCSTDQKKSVLQCSMATKIIATHFQDDPEQDKSYHFLEELSHNS